MPLCYCREELSVKWEEGNTSSLKEGGGSSPVIQTNVFCNLGAFFFETFRSMFRCC